MGEEGRERSRERTSNRRERPTRFSDGGGARDRSPDRGRERGGMKSSNARVYISNIPYGYRWQDLKDLFRSHVGEVAFVELFVDENDKPRGCGIVEFSDSSSVKKCLEVMHRFELKGRKMVIKEDAGNLRDKYGNLITGGRNRNREDRDWHRNDQGNNVSDFMQGGADKWGNTYGLSSAYLDNLQVLEPLCTRVFVANLDYKVDEKKLREVFWLAGKVQRVDLAVDKEGKSRGFGVVEFSHPVESVQAISMFHNQELFDRQMTVRMDRYNEQMKLPEGLKSYGPGLGDGGAPLRDVAFNLPNQSNQTSAPGILGAVPNIPMAAALSNLNTVGTIGSLNPTAVLQAANIAAGNLQGNLMSGELNLASLVGNPSFAALTGQNLNGSNSGNFGRDGFSTASSMGSNLGSGNTNRFSSYSTNTKDTFSGVNFNRDDHQSSFTAPSANAMSNIAAMSSMGTMRSAGAVQQMDMKFGGSNRILLENLPSSASFKMLSDKCREFGDVRNIEDKGNGAVLVTFANKWDVERAIKNLDRARIDGRTINAQMY